MTLKDKDRTLKKTKKNLKNHIRDPTQGICIFYISYYLIHTPG